MPRPIFILTLITALLSGEVLAAQEATGPVTTIALALRLYDEAAHLGDATGMAVAARLAGTIHQREARQWDRDGAAYAGPMLPDAASATLQITPDLLFSGAAWSGALLMAEEDEALSDLLYELPPPVIRGGVSVAASRLEPAREDRWVVPLPGLSQAEIAVFLAPPATETAEGEMAEGGAAESGAGPLPPLLWSVADSAGGILCPPREAGAAVCHFTPAENGFYTVVIANPSTRAGFYTLMAN